MKSLLDTKHELKALIPEGIDMAIKGIKAALAIGTDKYNDLLLLEGRYHHVTRQLIQGVISDEASQVEFNKIRKDLLDFIDDIQELHLSTYEKMGVDGRPDIYNGEVLYRIPKQMQKEVETKCFVRLAFDRGIITENLEKLEGDVIKDLRISEVMGVELLDPVGKAFEIRTLNDTVQFLEKDLFSEWIFFVKPILEGIHPLVLKISIIEIKDGIERKRNVVLEENVVVITTVPEKVGVAEAFSEAGIAVAIARSQMNMEEGPMPGVKPVLPPRPSAPSPAPAPAHRGTPFRKIATALSALLILLVASWAMMNYFSENTSPVSPGDDKHTASADQKDWDEIKDNPNQLDIRDFLKNHPDGELARKARNTLDSLDTDAWKSALASNDLAKMKEYIRQYPDGKYYVTAANMITEMESENVEKPPVPEKQHPLPANPGKSSGGKKKNPVKEKTDDKTTPKKTDSPPVTNPDPPKTPTVDPNTPISMKSASRLPIYPGCKNDNQEKERSCTNDKIGKYLRKNLKYPAEAERKEIEGTVVVQFIIEKDGSISGVQYNNDIGGGCATEAVRLVQRLPKFEPGLNSLGKPARIRYVLPIKFELR